MWCVAVCCVKIQNARLSTYDGHLFAFIMFAMGFVGMAGEQDYSHHLVDAHAHLHEIMKGCDEDSMMQF